MKFKPLYGQSNYDLCNKGFGSLDGFVKMCIDNSISDSDVVEDKEYFFDPNYVINKNYIGYDYATNVIEEV